MRKIWRGCFWLPHVGEHPGTIWAIVLPFMGGVAGGFPGILIMAVFVLPLYFYGAYRRCQEADAAMSQQEGKGA